MANILNSGMIIATDYQFAKLIDGSITEAVIPSSVTRINRGAFAYNSLLKKVYIPKNVRSLNNTAFSDCSNLEEVVFEDYGVQSISQQAFLNCSKLKEIRLPQGLVTLTLQAFWNCTGLEKVTIPRSATMGGQSFIACSVIKYIFIEGNNAITSGTTDVFNGSNNLRLYDLRYAETAKDKGSVNTFTANNVYLYINVPDGLYNNFVALPNWSALDKKHFVHSCDKATFEEIANPIDGDYYSLKGDTNYLNPLGEKQIDIRQYKDGQWVEIDIG